jgi:hypothetical protein
MDLSLAQVHVHLHVYFVLAVQTCLRVLEPQIRQPRRFMDIQMWNAVLSENTWRFGCDISEVAISNDSKIKQINIFFCSY